MRPGCRALFSCAFTVLLGIGMLVQSASAGLKIEFNYEFDTTGMFNDPARREVLEVAGRSVNRWLDDLEPIVENGSNTWLGGVWRPDTGQIEVIPGSELTVAADTIIVYVGARPLPGGTAAEAHANISGAYGTQAWKDLVKYRGEQGGPFADFGLWGGSITFDTSVNWYFDVGTSGLNGTNIDFLSVAMHELGHVLGFGIADSFTAKTAGNSFVGSHAVAVGSPNNPGLTLDAMNDHWASGTQSFVGGTQRGAILDPYFTPGVREYMTKLDFAALRDIGWELASVGDANLDGNIDSLDLFAAGPKFGTMAPATWQEGNWSDEGASFGVVDAIDLYLASELFGQTGASGNLALSGDDTTPGTAADGKPSIIYDFTTGEVLIDTDGDTTNTYVLDSLAGIFSAFANHDPIGGTIFVTANANRLAENFHNNLNGVHSLGFVAQPFLDQAFLLADLTLQGGATGQPNFEFDLVLQNTPEPTTLALLGLGLFGLVLVKLDGWRRRRRVALAVARLASNHRI